MVSDAAAEEGQFDGITGGFHPWGIAQLLYESAVEARFLLRRIAGRGEVETGDRNAAGVEAQFRLGGLTEAADEESGADDRDTGEGDLADHQPPPGDVCGTARGGRAAGLAQTARGVWSEATCRAGAMADSTATRRQSTNASENHSRVDLNLGKGGQREVGGWDQPEHRVTHPHGEQQAYSSGGDGEQQSLREYLRKEAHGAGAHRQAQRVLRLPRERPCEQKIGDVGAGHQQEKDGHAGERGKRRKQYALEPEMRLPQRQHNGAAAGVRGRVLGGEAAGHRFGLCAGLLQRGIGT